ncbi:MAG: RusA family crossover junction endodeoxyribonuclease [Betaproteobacteria bacterium]|nr:RusA family crossover junction endodeoxyribonuclease [Betaproteobacteria bacterium]
MNQVEFLVPFAKPHGKARPRVTSRGTFTPAATRTAERKVATHAQLAMRGRKPFQGPVVATIDAFFPIPPSWPKWRQAAALANTVAPTVRPDCDNAAKLALDACNGVVFDDDSQVVSLLVRKLYAAHGGLRVSVSEIPTKEG